MDDTTFSAARRLAARTSRPDTAFALLIALLSLDGGRRAADLAVLIGVQRPALSAAARELEAAGALVRKSGKRSKKSIGSPQGAEGAYTLAASWKERAFQLPVSPAVLRKE